MHLVTNVTRKIPTLDDVRSHRVSDPYPVYRRFRATNPVYWDERSRTWHLTRYANVSACLRDRRLSAERRIDAEPIPQKAARTFETLVQCFHLWMIFKEPPEHSRLRRPCNPGFSAPPVEAMTSRIEELIDHLLDRMPHDTVIDLMETFARPLPAMTVGDMLGMSQDDIPQLAAWTNDVVSALTRGLLTPKAAASYRAVIEHLKGRLLQSGTASQNVLLRELVAAERRSEISVDELVANAALLLMAGHDTTTNLIGNGVLCLLRHPAQLLRLREDETLTSTAVDELLRYESPVQYVRRTASEDLEVAGHTIHAGEDVVLWLGSANRDADRFADPEALDVGRRDNGHLAFIAGVHYCLGAPLAKLEGRLVLRALIRRYHSIELATDDIQWNTSPGIRGLQRLPVIVRC